MSAGAVRRMPDAAARELESSTPRIDAEVLLAERMQRNRTWLYVHPEAELPDAVGLAFPGATACRVEGEPVAYLLGRG